MEHPWGRHSYWNAVLDVPPSRAPLQSQQYTKKPGGTQLSFWCAARRVANGGLKNGYAPKIGAKAKRTEFLEKKKCGLKNWILAKFEALEQKFWLKLGSRTKMFKNCDFCWKGDHKKLKHAEMGVPVPLFKVIPPPEQKAYYPNMQISWRVNYNVNVLGHSTHSDQNSVK